MPAVIIDFIKRVGRDGPAVMDYKHRPVIIVVSFLESRNHAMVKVLHWKDIPVQAYIGIIMV